MAIKSEQIKCAYLPPTLRYFTLIYGCSCEAILRTSMSVGKTYQTNGDWVIALKGKCIFIKMIFFKMSSGITEAVKISPIVLPAVLACQSIHLKTFRE